MRTFDGVSIMRTFDVSMIVVAVGLATLTFIFILCTMAESLFRRRSPKAGIKPAGAKSEEERVLYCNGLRGLRVGVHSYAKSA